MSFVAKAVKGIFGGGKPAATPALAAAPAASTGPRITPLGGSDVLRIDPRRRKALSAVLPPNSVLSDKLG
jgi:hypothetical protein